MRKLLALIPIALLAFAAGEMAMIQPDEMAAKLSSKPAIFYVGPNVMYRNKHIPGAIFAGPGMNPAGIALLKQAVAKLLHPRIRGIHPLEHSRREYEPMPQLPHALVDRH